LENRIIKPAIESARLLKLERGEWNREEPGVVWRGFHGFRRGLTSNLYGMGVNPKLIAAILRHADIGTTLEYYVQTPDNETRDALQKLETKFKTPGNELAMSNG
jgi:integrase